MTKDGTISVKLDPMLSVPQLFPVIGETLSKYTEAWKLKQDAEILRHARLRFKFAGFRHANSGVYAEYTVTVEKF